MKNKILLSVLGTMILLVLSIGIFHYYHPTHYKFNDRFIIGKTEEDMAMRLYTLLREAETLCDVLIAVEPSEKDGIMKGVLNRLRKACASEDIPHETK